MDKFLYTGSVDTEALSEAQDLSGEIGRLGIGLKTKFEILACNSIRWGVVRGKTVPKPCQVYHDIRREHFCSSKIGYISCFRKTVNQWVSDHFGIAVGIRVR